MTGLCVDNTEGRLQTLLYIQTTANSGNIVRGHVDLAERVNKSFWKDNINRQAIIGKIKILAPSDIFLFLSQIVLV